MAFKEEYDTYNELHFKRRNLQEKLRALRISSETAKGIRYDKIPGANGFSDPNLAICIRKEELETELNAVDERIKEIRQKLVDIIHQKIRPGSYRYVAMECLVKRENIQDVAAAVCRSEANIRRMKNTCFLILTDSLQPRRKT